MRASVVIPTHKRLEFLPLALASALNQSVTDIEVLVAVDGEDPDTVSYLKTVADPRVRVLYDGIRKGEALNTSRAMSAAKAPFVGVLHDDDLWEPELLESLLAALDQHPEASVAFADHLIIDAQGHVDEVAGTQNSRRYGRDALTYGPLEDPVRAAVIDQSIPAVMTALYRSTALDFSDMPDLPANFDYWLGWISVRDGAQAVYVPASLSRYRVHASQGTSTARPQWLDALVEIYGCLLSDPRAIDVHDELRGRLAGVLILRAKRRLQLGSSKALADALWSLRQAVTLRGLVLASIALVIQPWLLLGAAWRKR